MKPLWTEADRRAARDHYWALLLPLPLPRWYKQAMAERLASAHLEATLKEAERRDAEKEATSA